MESTHEVEESIAAVREEIARLHGDLLRYNLVTRTGERHGPSTGCRSVRHQAVGVSYGNLAPENMILCDLDGNFVPGSLGGKRAPSSDTGAHAYVYRHIPKGGGVVHTYSTYAAA